MEKGFVRIVKIAMATIVISWIVMNLEALYKQTMNLLIPLYIFFFFNLIILCVLFSSSSASKSNPILAKIQSILGNSKLNPTSQESILFENQLSRSFSEIWYRIMDKEDDRFAYTEKPHDSNEECEDKKDEAEIIVEEEEVQYEEEDEKDSLEDTWKSIMEGKQKELKKSNTWDVTPSIEQMKGKPHELKPSKSLKLNDEVEGYRGGEASWGWRRMEVVLSRDELNQRAEEFITKIKNNIRLERLESYNLFLNLINRNRTN